MRTKIIGPNVATASATERDVVGPVLGMSIEEMSDLAKTILVTTPHRSSEGMNAGLYYNAGHWARFGMAYAGFEDQFGGFIELSRYGIVRHFLDYAKDRPEIDKLIMVDADENVPWDSPFRLAAWDKPVVSGIICNFSQAKGAYACVQFKDKYGSARFPSSQFTKKIPGRGLKEAHSVGTGLVCIKKVVLETIIAGGDYPFRIPEDVRDSCFETGTMKQGEDIAFSHQCEKYGFQRYVDFSVRGEHYKTLPIGWPRGDVDYDLDAAEWTVDERDFLHG